MLNVNTQFLFNMTADMEPEFQSVGKTPHGVRMIVTVTQGTFNGPKLRGTLMRGGGDWALIRSDGVMEVDVRLTLKTDDEALIYLTYHGLVRDAPSVFKRRALGETLNPAMLYFRTLVSFETGSDKYSWLNQTVAVGVGQLTPGSVIYDIHEIL
jgi:hypothetical protein